ncbi:MAG: single-stranded-DNA-specific exonuclease RecJ [Holosporaceae bacterium]|nr:single-stranded-DNA-specific exonuclease RecJ [Holosporaceae bacterium]
MIDKIVSVANKVWKVQTAKMECVDADALIAAIAQNRGIENLDAFLHTTLESAMPDPFVFIDLEKAASRIAEAIKNEQQIAILGDYDVDGVASVSIFVNFLKHLGASFSYSIPNRTGEGYGLNVNALDKHKNCLIVAVDCGSNSQEELLYAKDHGLEVIVIDHHKMSALPAAFALVNPHRPDEKDDYKHLCATGLAFMCLIGVDKLLRESGFYQDRREPPLMEYLDLVALATVCDVVSLTGLNRAFVSTGIKVIRQRKNLGIDALAALYKGHEITAETISFFFGPRLNAAGRISSADMSVRLLTTGNPIEAKKIAKDLDNLNRERQMLEQKIMEEVAPSVDENLNFICSYHPEWHVGVIGIVAGRLKEKYNRLSIIISRDSNGKGKGKASCRSVDGVDLSELIHKGIQCGIISSGGGHALAAGFSIEIDKINALVEFLKTEIRHETPVPEIQADCFLDLESLSVDLLQSISALEPFGMGNKRPKFVIPNVRISFSRVVGENHIAATLQDEKGNSLRAIAFKSLNTELGDALLNERRPVSAVGACVIASWKDERYVSFQLEDLAIKENNLQSAGLT